MKTTNSTKTLLAGIIRYCMALTFVLLGHSTKAQTGEEAKTALIKWVNQYTGFLIKIHNASTENSAIAIMKEDSKSIVDNLTAAMDVLAQYDKTHSATDERKLREEIKKDPALKKWDKLEEDYSTAKASFKAGPEFMKVYMDLMTKIDGISDKYHFKLKDDE